MFYGYDPLPPHFSAFLRLRNDPQLRAFEPSAGMISSPYASSVSSMASCMR